MVNNTIRIEELMKRINISDTDLIIVEDEIDTKQSTVRELKRSFLGDGVDPSEYKFFSSQKVTDLVNSLKISISTLPSRSEFDDLSQQVKNITGSTGSEKDSELVAARGTYATLSDRLAGDQKSLEKKYIQYPQIEMSGSRIDLSDYDDAHITISALPYNEQTTINVIGCNRYTHGETGYDQVVKTSTGIKITYTRAQNAFNVPIGNTLNAGSFIFYAKPSFSENFVKEGTVLKLIHIDDSVTIVDYNYQNMIRFSSDKNIKAFQILPNVTTIVDDMWVQLDDIMISEDNTLTKYYSYTDQSFTVNANEGFSKELDVSKCIITRSKSTITVHTIDTSYTGTRIKQEIENIKTETLGDEDHCGLLENKGQYIFADGKIVVNSSNRCTLKYDSRKSRNSHPSAKITIMDYTEDDQPRFTLVPDTILNLNSARTVSFQFYIDKTLSERFAEDDGIKIMLSSDETISNPCANYMYFDIGKNSFVQGWNTIKLKISDFLPHGNPNLGNITQINFRIFTSNFTNGKSFWFNSMIIDQRMKPIVLLAFDNFYDTAFDYQFPYLYSRDIPATIFANNKQTLTRAYMEKVALLHYQYGWDLGNYGCNPNKEIMTEDDNPREQYMAVKDTRQWFYDNFTSNVISYAAPFGNLRPISEPLLKELGFKIAKADADAYCSFFSKNDFIVPMHLLSNAEGKTIDDVKKKIDEIVETGQVLCIYTNDVTKYGDDISATQTAFEALVSYLEQYMQSGQLECMTFSEFYNKCIS